MSLGGVAPGEQAALRALAHPVRLQIMSLLTGAEMTAADVSRQLDITHANASYHLRNLCTAGLITHAGEERIRGGVAKRYRYDPSTDSGPFTAEQNRAFFPAVAAELSRRSADGRWPGVGLLSDAELWIDPEAWHTFRERISEAVHDLHAVARPARTPGTVRTSTTVALFEMESGPA
ncbi:helix-turn-helix domain-containing protein [Actinoplanes sp. NPDC051851]|uniref:ArsR/SmtB family transcription factor n=1 Tax=Actinoplanes sp. NPDC051851 TaxID=3154753 RepID=UPI00344A2292